MIYEIKGTDITKIKLEEAFIITLNADGSSALISSSVVPDYLEIISTVVDSDLPVLMSQEQWKQPVLNL
jgi:hypothetical protein